MWLWFGLLGTSSALNVQGGRGNAPVQELFYKPKNALKVARTLEKQGRNPAEFLEHIPPGVSGAEWILSNTPLAKDLGPDVIIGGVGESGSRGVKYLLENLGVSMCSRVNDKGDNYYTALGLSVDLEKCLKGSAGVFNPDGYAKAATPFISLVKEEIKGAYETRKCLGKVTKSTVWGWKNPRQAMLIPVIRAAFGTKPKIIITVRDPRDVCNARNQEQFEEYCPILLGRPCVARVDCYSFWAHVHYQFFELYNKRSQQICLVRIEDLFADPTEPGALSPGVVKRIGDAIGIEPTFDEAIKVLSEVSKFNNALVRDLMMPDSGDEKATRQQLLRETAFHGDPRVKQVMKHMGYNPASWDMDAPKSKMMC